MTENNTYKFSLKTIVIVLFFTITVVGGAVYTIVRLSMDDKNSALEFSISEKTKKLKEQKDEILRLKESGNLTYPIQSTTDYIAEGTENKEIIELKEKVIQLENERNIILNELVLKTYENLDPNSELSTLIKELSSDSYEIRSKAIEGLFIIKDPKSINALLAYFFKDSKEATNIKYYNDWINLITTLDKNAGNDFVIEMLKSDDKYMSHWGYDYFLDDMENKEEMKELIIKLQPIAINHANTLTRTRAKKIISEYTKVIENNEALPDNRSMFRVILDIEKKIDDLK